MYRCTCPDENTLCKHIHKVRIVSVRATQNPAQQAATANADARWRQEVNVDREVGPVFLGLRCKVVALFQMTFWNSLIFVQEFSNPSVGQGCTK